VACGALHAAFISAAGHCYTFGNGKFHRLGHGSQLSEYLPRRLIGGYLRNRAKMKDVSCGALHTILCDEYGAVYTFGWNRYGQLGIGRAFAYAPVPQLLVEAFQGKTIVKVACGRNHSLFLSDAGKVYSCGMGTMGQTGLGTRRHRDLRKSIDFFKDEDIRIVDIYCGNFTSFFMDEDNTVYCCGYQDDGQLAIGHTEESCLVPRPIATRTFLPPTTSGVTSIALGPWHGILGTEDGALFSFGSGDVGRLGHGGTSDEWTPRRIEALENRDVVAFAAAGTFSVFIEKGPRREVENEKSENKKIKK